MPTKKDMVAHTLVEVIMLIAFFLMLIYAYKNEKTDEQLFDLGKSINKLMSDSTKKDMEVEALRNQLKEKSEEIELMKNKYIGVGVESPPCLVDTSGAIVYLMEVDILNGGLIVNRKNHTIPAEYARIVEENSGRFISYSVFQSAFLPLYSKSKKSNCKIFVKVKDLSTEKSFYKKGMQVVEGYFYKKLVN